MADDEIMDDQEFTVPEMWELVKPTMPEDDEEDDAPVAKKPKAPPAAKVGKLVKMLNDIEDAEELEAKVQELDPATGQSLLLWASVNQKFVLVEWLVKKCQRAAFAFDQGADNVLAIFDKWVEIRKELEEKELEKALNPPEEEEENDDEDPEEKEPEPSAEQLVYEALSEYHEDWGKRGLGLVKMIGELGLYQGARDSEFTKEGVGRTLFPSGDMFCGEYKDNKRHGLGTYYWASKGMMYTGRWRNNVRDGVGRMVFPDGGRYLGAWSGNKRNGEGRYTYPDGSSYNGAWIDDVKNGFGTYTFVDGSQYIGSYVDGEFVSGEWRMAGGATRYFGAFQNDKPVGSGVFVFKHGKEGSYRQAGVYKNGVWQPFGPVLGIHTEPALRLVLQGKEHALKFTDECGGYSMEQLVVVSNFGPFIEWMRRVNATTSMVVESLFVSAVKFHVDDKSKVLEVRLRLVAKDAEGNRIRNTQAITLRAAATRLMVVLSDGHKSVGLLVKAPCAALGSNEQFALPTVRMGSDGSFYSDFTRLVQPALRLSIDRESTTQVVKPLMCAPQVDSREEDVRAYVQHIHPDAMSTLQERLDEVCGGNSLMSIVGVRLSEIADKTTDALTLLAARRVEALIAADKLGLATVEDQRPPTPLPPAAEPRPDIEPLLEEERIRMAKLAQQEEEDE